MDFTRTQRCMFSRSTPSWLCCGLGALLMKVHMTNSIIATNTYAGLKESRTTKPYTWKDGVLCDDDGALIVHRIISSKLGTPQEKGIHLYLYLYLYLYLSTSLPVYLSTCLSLYLYLCTFTSTSTSSSTCTPH